MNTPLTVAGTIADIYPKTGQTMTGKAGVKDVHADHLTEKNATLTEEKEIMQRAGKAPEAKETAPAYDEAQRELDLLFSSRSGQITNEYIKGRGKKFHDCCLSGSGDWGRLCKDTLMK